MTEQEKKALVYMKKDLEKADSLDLDIVNTDRYSVRTALNIIEKQQKEIEIKNNKLNMLKENAGKLSAKVIVDIIENYTGFFGGKI